jgi:hypothetical protein
MGSSIVSGAVLVALIVSGGSVNAQPSTAPASQSPAAQQSAVPATHLFTGDAGLILNFIKPEKASDFESIISKLQEALRTSHKPERRQQAAGWKVFRAAEPAANGAILYIFVLDRVVKGADYAVSTILAEAFPNEVQALYKQYVDAYVSGQNLVNLTLTADLADPSEK